MAPSLKIIVLILYSVPVIRFHLLMCTPRPRVVKGAIHIEAKPYIAS